MDEWSEPDPRGVRSRALDVGARATLRGRRRRRNFTREASAAAAWPVDWRELARSWLSGGETLRWITLVKRAGPGRVATAQELLDALLSAGWIELDEKREPGGRWVPVQITIIDLERCRETLGLPNRARETAAWAEARAQVLSESLLADAARQLDDLAPALALRRHRWLHALDRWSVERRSGTRRDFAYFASGQTKGIPAADWVWLAAVVDLNAFAVDPHTPLLLIRGPLSLILPGGRLDLGATPDFNGLTPASLAACRSVEGGVEHYRLIENQTSFEHACHAARADGAVVWLPGQPPGWWREAMSQLLALCPAPALIEADPDPSGIAIACEAGRLWTHCGLSWSADNMTAATLDRLPHVQPLTEADAMQLDRLLHTDMPQALMELALSMRRRGVKGEQEGLRIAIEADGKATLNP